MRRISPEELSSHATVTDGWIALNNAVWDFTNFAAVHPGGEEIIINHLGKDGSVSYNEIHSPGLVASYLKEARKVGSFVVQSALSSDDKTASSARGSLPPLNTISSLAQFRDVAEQALTEKAWLYIAGATEDGVTIDANKDYYRRIMFRPRLLQGVATVDTSSQFLGFNMAIPIMIAPTSSVKLTHPEGELALAKASKAAGVLPILPSMSSYSMAEVSTGVKGGPFLFQLYVNRNRAETDKLLDEVCQLGAKAILVTADLPVMSKRETQSKPSASTDSPGLGTVKAKQAAPPPVNSVIDANLRWDDIEYFKRRTGLPIFVKGIQRASDAIEAWRRGCAGIYLSNHGGRALDTTPPAILTLLEIRRYCPELLSKMEVIVDGGITRGSDALKAVCLGATAVCIGRPFLHALVYGESGVRRAFEILKEEFTMAMQLLGITSLQQATPDMVNTKGLDWLVPSHDSLYSSGTEVRPRL